MSLILPFIILSAASLSVPPTNEKVEYCRVPCKAKKPKKVVKKVVEKPAPLPTKVETVCCSTPVNVQVVVKQDQKQPVAVAAVAVTTKNSDPLTLGVRGALGFWSCEPYTFALLGARLRSPNTRLGLEVNHQFYWGLGLQGMVYPLQGSIKWHLNAGALVFNNLGLSAQDVTRGWDLTLGTGLELPLSDSLSLTADWRYAFPNPVTLVRYSRPDDNGRYLRVNNVLGSSFYRSQFMLGLLLRVF